MNQVTLPVSNMEEAVSFYLAFGLTQIVDNAHYARFSFPSGDATFSLSLESEPFNNGAIVYFESERLDELVESLVAKGIVFEQLPTEQRYLWKEAILKDPSWKQDQALLDGENRLHPPWRVEKRA